MFDEFLARHEVWVYFHLDIAILLVFMASLGPKELILLGLELVDGAA